METIFYTDKQGWRDQKGNPVENTNSPSIDQYNNLQQEGKIVIPKEAILIGVTLHKEQGRIYGIVNYRIEEGQKQLTFDESY